MGKRLLRERKNAAKDTFKFAENRAKELAELLGINEEKKLNIWVGEFAKTGDCKTAFGADGQEIYDAWVEWCLRF